MNIVITFFYWLFDKIVYIEYSHRFVSRLLKYNFEKTL